MTPKGKILVVDDDRLVLTTVTHGLAGAGFEVFDADNGDDAILLARKHRPDLALLDVRMDGLNGFDVAEYLRDHLRTPFMFLSAFSDDGTVAKVKALGAIAYLVKPLEIGQIVPAVEAAFAKLRSAGDAAAGPGAASAESAVQDVVAIALGVLMHRYSLTRTEALQRLRKVAAADSRALAEQAERLVAAVEELARPS